MVARGTDVKAVESDVFTVAATTAPAVAPVTVQSTTYEPATSTLTVNVDKTLKASLTVKLRLVPKWNNSL